MADRWPTHPHIHQLGMGCVQCPQTFTVSETVFTPVEWPDAFAGQAAAVAVWLDTKETGWY